MRLPHGSASHRNSVFNYADIARGESNDKEGKKSFYVFGTAEPNPILCKCSKNNSSPPFPHVVFFIKIMMASAL